MAERAGVARRCPHELLGRRSHGSVLPVPRPVDAVGGGLRIDVAALALAGAANVLLPRVGRAAFVPAALAVAAGMTWLARAGGATWHDLGMDPREATRGLRYGAAVGIPAAACVALAPTLRIGREMIVDRRIATATRRDFAYHVLLRIPFGTALPEEVTFRAAVPAIVRRRSPRAADAVAAALFGVWHVVDALEQLETHPRRAAARGAAGRAAVVAGTVLATAGAGVAFASLRDRARSIVAPAVVHAAVNATGFVTGVLAARRARGAS